MNTNNTAYQYTLFTVKGDSMDNGKRNSFEDGDTVFTEQVETSGLAQAIEDPMRHTPQGAQPRV